jgi:hypothetical protein
MPSPYASTTSSASNFSILNRTLYHLPPTLDFADMSSGEESMSTFNEKPLFELFEGLSTEELICFKIDIFNLNALLHTVHHRLQGMSQLERVELTTQDDTHLLQLTVFKWRIEKFLTEYLSNKQPFTKAPLLGVPEIIERSLPPPFQPSSIDYERLLHIDTNMGHLERVSETPSSNYTLTIQKDIADLYKDFLAESTLVTLWHTAKVYKMELLLTVCEMLISQRLFIRLCFADHFEQFCLFLVDNQVILKEVFLGLAGSSFSIFKTPGATRLLLLYHPQAKVIDACNEAEVRPYVQEAHEAVTGYDSLAERLEAQSAPPPSSEEDYA